MCLRCESWGLLTPVQAALADKSTAAGAQHCGGRAAYPPGPSGLQQSGELPEALLELVEHRNRARIEAFSGRHEERDEVAEGDEVEKLSKPPDTFGA